MKKKYINHKNIYFSEQARRELLLWLLAALVGILAYQFMNWEFDRFWRVVYYQTQ